MNSFLTVNNNVSLISITIAPSTYLASFVIFLVLFAIFITRLPFKLPRLAFSIPQFLRQPLSSSLSTWDPAVDKALPEPPDTRGGSSLILQDQSLILARPDLIRLRRQRNHYPALHSQPSPPPPERALEYERDHRSSRRLSEGLRASSQPAVLAPLDGPQRAGDSNRRRRRGVRPGEQSSPKLGDRFRRWLLTTGVAETRKRKSQQRLLETPAR